MFSTDEDLIRADWPLLQNGAVNLFWNIDVFTETKNDLAALGYEIREVSCLDGDIAFREQMSEVLGWERQFGYSGWTGNLDAFNDAMRYYPFGGSNRSALAVSSYQKLVSADPTFAGDVLDIIEYAARDHLLFGNTLIALIQTDDNRFETAPLGGRPARWNSKE
jgi:hypothetical protein